MRKYGRRSISTSILLAFTALILAVTLSTVFESYRFTREELQDNATDYTTQLVRQVNADIERYVNYIKDISDFIVGNPLVTAYLSTGDRPVRDAQKDRIVQVLGNVAEIRSEISAIALLSLDGQVVFGDRTSVLNLYSDYKDTLWYRGALAAPGEVFISSSHVENLIAGKYQWVVSFAKAVIGADGVPIGILLVDLNYNTIDEICANVQLGSRGYLFLLDSQGEILWHPEQNLIYANLKTENVQGVLEQADGRSAFLVESTDKLYIASRSESTGWMTVGVAYPEELLQNPGRMARQYLVIGTIAVFVAFLLSFLISRAITDPLRRLTDTMNLVEQGDFTVRCNVRSQNEVGRLRDSFNHMIANTQNLMEQIVSNEEQKRRSEWRLLQAQIKPHFLYNTLDSIIWMSHAGKNEEVVEMTSALAKLLRNSIGSGREIIPLEEELAHVESYLVIQKMRYREKLHYKMDIDPQTKPCLIPRLVLQPLVENAIYHGIKVKEVGGTIQIGAMLDDDRLLVTVEDDGAGMTAEQLAHIYDQKSGDESSSQIGVCNVKERLRIYFGEDAALKYFSEPDKGTMAMLILPIRLEETGGFS